MVFPDQQPPDANQVFGVMLSLFVLAEDYSYLDYEPRGALTQRLSKESNADLVKMSSVLMRARCAVLNAMEIQRRKGTPYEGDELAF
jgi:hypothetical protein